MNLKIEISWASLWKVLAITAGAFLAYRLREVVVAILLSVFVSTALSGGVTRLEKLKVPRILGTIMVFVASLSIVAFLIYTVIPIAIIELNSLLGNLNGVTSKILGSEATESISKFISPNLGNLANVLLSGNAPLLDVIGVFLGGATYFFTVLVLSFYLTVSHNGVRDFMRAILPRSIENGVIGIYERTAKKIGKWFNAQLLLCSAVGLTVGLALWLMGVKYALTLGLLAGVFELVPVIGPIFSGAIAVVIASSDSMSLGIYVLILFLIVQQIESNVLVPLVLRKAIEIHPAVILISLLGGIKLAGLPGMLLAIPVAVVAVELIENWSTMKSANKPAHLPNL